MLPIDFLSSITDFVKIQFGNFAPIVYLIIGIFGFLYVAEVIISSLRGLVEKRAAQFAEPTAFQKAMVKTEERVGRKLTKKERELARRAFVLEQRFKQVMKGKGVSTLTN